MGCDGRIVFAVSKLGVHVRVERRDSERTCRRDLSIRWYQEERNGRENGGEGEDLRQDELEREESDHPVGVPRDPATLMQMGGVRSTKHTFNPLI